ncbi:transposase [Caloramator sp. E03]|uniref:transposase n=1 Tax=Caloramator sp. E03 TaxID=2576307 RepID=UPI0011108520|nr:transposase [Caloramator sp. E03]QCX34064.1 transposase [Caloramator sp. E03]
MVLSQLDFTTFTSKLSKPNSSRVPKGYNTLPLLYALIDMKLEKIKNISTLVQRLATDFIFKYNCGFDILNPLPPESTFSKSLINSKILMDLKKNLKL